MRATSDSASRLDASLPKISGRALELMSIRMDPVQPLDAANISAVAPGAVGPVQRASLEVARTRARALADEGKRGVDSASETPKTCPGNSLPPESWPQKAEHFAGLPAKWAQN